MSGVLTLKYLDILEKTISSIRSNEKINISDDVDIYINTIKQALLKAQEQEEVLRIIKEKEVDVFRLTLCETNIDYNTSGNFMPKYRKLTKIEFELLKECLKNEL